MTAFIGKMFPSVRFDVEVSVDRGAMNIYRVSFETGEVGCACVKSLPRTPYMRARLEQLITQCDEEQLALAWIALDEAVARETGEGIT